MLIIRSTLFISILFLFSSGARGLCGYGGCPKTKEGFLNVHLVPHSHMDMGWVQTVDQYYDGGYTEATVKDILDSVVVALQNNENRRFISSETGYFSRWWKDQNMKTKETVRSLIKSGQFEFVHGGWVMNDEACSHYNEIVDQMTLGLRFLNETFGHCGIPKVAWQIDPFGHSSEQASIFSQMGYDGLFIGRLDYQDKARRIKHQEMEMIWSGSTNNLGKDAWLFTGALYNTYDPPYGFCYDKLCRERVEITNWDDEAENFIELAQDWSKAYQTNHIIMPMGSDFHYSHAEEPYSKMDDLIKHVNKMQKTRFSKVNVIYSTPACYLNEVHKANLTLPLKTDDFFPYGSSANALWTGYFTSRPTLKYFIHKTNNFLQACKQLAADASEEETIENSINNLQVLAESMAIAQHHDAVSGTAKQHVTNDYAKRIDIGIKSCERVIGDAFRIHCFLTNENSEANVKRGGSDGFLFELHEIYNTIDSKYEYRHATVVFNIEKNISQFKINIMHGNDQGNNSWKKEESMFEFCHQLNISVCTGTESKDEFLLSVYNPLARDLSNSYLRIPVTGSGWKVLHLNGSILPTSIPIPERVRNIPGRESEADYEIIFPTGTLPGLTVSYFAVTKLNSSSETDETEGRKDDALQDFDGSDFQIENSLGVKATFDGSSGLLKSIQRGNAFQNVTQNFYYYEAASTAKSSYNFQASGAYVFRPDNQHPHLIKDKVDFKIIKGEFVTEVHQNFSKWISQVIRLYDNSEALEFEWIVGPIPIKDDIGKEIITKYTSDIKTNGVFFTDANGRELQKRKRDYRPSWHYKVNEKVSGNYYPVNSRIIISENGDLPTNQKTLILLNDRAQGGTSMNDGEMEIMVHRCLLDDDGFGVVEPLNEKAFSQGLVVRGKHWLVFAGGETGISNSIHRKLAQEIFMDKIIGISNLSYRRHLFPHNTMFSQLGSILPPNIHLLTLEPVSKSTFLLRLEHIYESREHSDYSQRVVIKTKDIRRAIPFIRSIRETTLSGNQWKNESSRLTWTTHDVAGNEDISKNKQGNTGDIVLNPMEIKTFLMEI